MKRTPLILLIAVIILGLALLHFQSGMLRKIYNDKSLPEVEHNYSESIQNDGDKPSKVDVTLAHEYSVELDQTWLENQVASIEVIQTIDSLSGEPLGTIKAGKFSTTLGETPPFYRYHLKTVKHPILIGDKDTRHHFERTVSSVHIDENGIFLKSEISVGYPRSAGLGGLILLRDEETIKQLGIIIPDVQIPEGYDPTSSQWIIMLRIADREITPSDLAKAKPYEFSENNVLVLPTRLGPPPAQLRVLWLAIQEDGSFVID